jgi:ankyrin repeat protein
LASSSTADGTQLALDFSGSYSAADDARLHVGNNYSTSNYNYTVRKCRSDETLREDQRDRAFLESAAEGQLQRLKHLHRLGVDIDNSDEQGLTALHHAVLSGFEDVVEFLWEIGCNVNAQSVNYGTPLCLAALKGRERIVEFLTDNLRRANINAVGKWRGTPLHCAVYAAHLPTLEALLRKRPDLNRSAVVHCGYVTEDGPRHNILDPITKGPQPGIATLAIDGAPLLLALELTMGRARRDRTLFEARESIIDALLEASASPSQSGSRVYIARSPIADHHKYRKRREVRGLTPLMVAARQGLLHYCEILLEKGADLSAADSSGGTALHYAAVNGESLCLQHLLEKRPKPFWDYKSQRQVDNVLERRNSLEGTALCTAASGCHLECVEILCKAGSNVDVLTPEGCPLILDAAKRGEQGLVNLLSDNGGSLLQKNDVSLSLLKLAMSTRSRYLQELLNKQARQILCLPVEQCQSIDGISDPPLLPHRVEVDLADRVNDVLDRSLSSSTHRGPMDGASWALRQAVIDGEAQVAKVFLRQGGDPRAQDTQGRNCFDHVYNRSTIDVSHVGDMMYTMFADGFQERPSALDTSIFTVQTPALGSEETTKVGVETNQVKITSPNLEWNIYDSTPRQWLESGPVQIFRMRLTRMVLAIYKSTDSWILDRMVALNAVVSVDLDGSEGCTLAIKVASGSILQPNRTYPLHFIFQRAEDAKFMHDALWDRLID